MKVYVMNYGGSTIGVYSSKKKMYKAFVRRCNKYREEIINDLKNALQGIYRSDIDRMKEVDVTCIRQILNLFVNGYESSEFTFHELSTCVDSDYTFDIYKMDK